MRGRHEAELKKQGREKSERLKQYAQQGSCALIHVKTFLLGHIWWHDEDGSPGGVAEVTGFTTPNGCGWTAPTEPKAHGRVLSSASGWTTPTYSPTQNSSWSRC